jgi:hypothetical protein
MIPTAGGESSQVLLSAVLAIGLAWLGTATAKQITRAICSKTCLRSSDEVGKSNLQMLLASKCINTTRQIDCLQAKCTIRMDAVRMDAETTMQPQETKERDASNKQNRGALFQLQQFSRFCYGSHFRWLSH